MLGSAERARTSAFDVMQEQSWPAPWRRVDTSSGLTAGYAPRTDDTDAATAYLRTELRARPERVVAIVFDPRDTGLAGDLTRWIAEPAGDRMQRVHYELQLPGPFRPRAFRIAQRHFQDGATHYLLSNDDDDAPGPGPSPGTILARLHRSDYRLTETATGVVFERIISLDLGLPLPRGVFARMLGKEQITDADRLARALEG